MKIRAIAFGFYRQKRKPGDVFEFDGIPSGKWMEPADEAAREAFEKAGFKVAQPPAPVLHEEGKDSFVPKKKGFKGKWPKRGEKASPDSPKGTGSTGDQEVI